MAGEEGRTQRKAAREERVEVKVFLIVLEVLWKRMIICRRLKAQHDVDSSYGKVELLFVFFLLIHNRVWDV